MKTLLIIPAGTVSAADLSRLRKDGFCAIISTEPKNVRLIEHPVDGLPVERACVKMIKEIISYSPQTPWVSQEIAAKLVRHLSEGTALEQKKVS